MSENNVCPRFIELLNLRLDGDLSPEDSKILFNHLSKCEPCLLHKKRLDAVMKGFSQPGFVSPEIPAATADVLKTAWHEAMKEIDSQAAGSTHESRADAVDGAKPVNNVLIFTSEGLLSKSSSFLRMGSISRAAGIAAIFLSTFLLTRTMMLQSGQPDSASATAFSAGVTMDKSLSLQESPSAVALSSGKTLAAEANGSVSLEKARSIGGSLTPADTAVGDTAVGDAAIGDAAIGDAAIGKFNLADALKNSDPPNEKKELDGISERLTIPDRYMDAAARESDRMAFSELALPRPGTRGRNGSSGAQGFSIQPAMGTLRPAARKGLAATDADFKDGSADGGKRAEGLNATVPRDPEMASYLSHESSMPGAGASSTGSLSFVILTANGPATSKDVGEILATVGATDIRPGEFATSGGTVRTFEARLDPAAVSILGSRFEHLRSARMTLAPNIRSKADSGPVAIQVTVRETP